MVTNQDMKRILDRNSMVLMAQVNARLAALPTLIEKVRLGREYDQHARIHKALGIARDDYIQRELAAVTK